jgi:hypothetical protein
VRTIAFFNHAGGAAKSSSVRDIGFALAQEGFKVLVGQVGKPLCITALNRAPLRNPKSRYWGKWGRCPLK